MKQRKKGFEIIRPYKQLIVNIKDINMSQFVNEAKFKSLRGKAVL